MATMRVVESTSVVRGIGESESRSSRHDDSAALVGPRRGATSVPSGELDSDERCTIGDSPRLLLVDWLVQLFVVGTRYVPQTAQRLLASSDLPPSLERVAMQAQRCLQRWFAWTDGPRTWFVVTEIAPVAARDCQDKALRMFFYDEDGRFVSWGTWVFQRERSWTLCER